MEEFSDAEIGTEWKTIARPYAECRIESIWHIQPPGTVDTPTEAHVEYLLDSMTHTLCLPLKVFLGFFTKKEVQSEIPWIAGNLAINVSARDGHVIVDLGQELRSFGMKPTEVDEFIEMLTDTNEKFKAMLKEEELSSKVTP